MELEKSNFEGRTVNRTITLREDQTGTQCQKFTSALLSDYQTLEYVINQKFNFAIFGPCFRGHQFSNGTFPPREILAKCVNCRAKWISGIRSLVIIFCDKFSLLNQVDIVSTLCVFRKYSREWFPRELFQRVICQWKYGLL